MVPQRNRPFLVETSSTRAAKRETSRWVALATAAGIAALVLSLYALVVLRSIDRKLDALPQVEQRLAATDRKLQTVIGELGQVNANVRNAAPLLRQVNSNVNDASPLLRRVNENVHGTSPLLRSVNGRIAETNKRLDRLEKQVQAVRKPLEEIARPAKKLRKP